MGVRIRGDGEEQGGRREARVGWEKLGGFWGKGVTGRGRGSREVHASSVEDHTLRRNAGFERRGNNGTRVERREEERGSRESGEEGVVTGDFRAVAIIVVNLGTDYVIVNRRMRR